MTTFKDSLRCSLAIMAGSCGGRRRHRPPADAGIAPFSAHYQADWKSINVGTSDLELKQDTDPGHYVYTWTITARGIFRLYRDEVTQKSWLSIDADHVRPDKYRAEDGSSSVNLDFDWDGGHVRGTSENKPVDLTLKEGTQDVHVHSGRSDARSEERQFAQDLPDHRQG